MDQQLPAPPIPHGSNAQVIVDLAPEDLRPAPDLDWLAIARDRDLARVRQDAFPRGMAAGAFCELLDGGRRVDDGTLYAASSPSAPRTWLWVGDGGRICFARDIGEQRDVHQEPRRVFHLDVVTVLTRETLAIAAAVPAADETSWQCTLTVRNIRDALPASVFPTPDPPSVLDHPCPLAAYERSTAATGGDLADAPYAITYRLADDLLTQLRVPPDHRWAAPLEPPRSAQDY